MAAESIASKRAARANDNFKNDTEARTGNVELRVDALAAAIANGTGGMVSGRVDPAAKGGLPSVSTKPFTVWIRSGQGTAFAVRLPDATGKGAVTLNGADLEADDATRNQIEEANGIHYVQFDAPGDYYVSVYYKDKCNLGSACYSVQLGKRPPNGNEFFVVEVLFAKLDDSGGRLELTQLQSGTVAASCTPPYDDRVEPFRIGCTLFVADSEFWFDGQLVTTSTAGGGIQINQGDFALYIVCRGTKAPGAAEDDPYTWTFTLSTETGFPAGSSERVLNVQLYQFNLNTGEVQRDYRGVNLPVFSGTAGGGGGGGGGGGADPDDVSIDDDGDNGTLEIKSWAATNRPESPTTVAEDLVADVPPGDQLVVRDANGALKYKGVGTLTFPSHVPGNFEPAFGANDSFSIGPGFVPVGRLFYYVSQPTLDSGVLSWVTGLIYIEVTHTVDSAGNPQAPSFVFKQTDNPGIFVNASDKTVSRIPLYQLNAKVMAVDFRSCMSLTMREG